MSESSGRPFGWGALVAWPTGYCEEIRVFKAGLGLDTLAWDNNCASDCWLQSFVVDRDSWGH